MYDNNDNGLTNTATDQTDSTPVNAVNGSAYPTSATPFDSSFVSNPAHDAIAYSPSNQITPTTKSPEPVTTTANNTVPPTDDELQNIKQTALQNLLPLVGKLDQEPEEKFQTLLMVIQASDNLKLIKEAYETAGKIKDDSERAKALLDIINEINYFTVQKPQVNEN